MNVPMGYKMEPLGRPRLPLGVVYAIAIAAARYSG